MNIGILGSGSFGTAIAVLLAKKKHKINIFDRDKEVVEIINRKRYNPKYLKDIRLDEEITAYGNAKDTVKDADFIVIAVPSVAVRSVCQSIKSFVNKNIPIICVAKGIENDTNLRLSEVISSELDNPVVMLSGPSHAEEIVKDVPTSVVVSSNDMKAAEKVQELFMVPTFRVYTNDDLVAVEIGGAIKNTIALAIGMCDGYGMGDNAKAAIMTRGMAEVVRIGVKLGGRPETFLGLTGMGDLIVTCTSEHSRNRRYGKLIGQGVDPKEALKSIGMVVEGVETCKSIYDIKEKANVEMPIIDVVYKILFENLKMDDAMNLLLNRSKKSEF